MRRSLLLLILAIPLLAGCGGGSRAVTGAVPQQGILSTAPQPRVAFVTSVGGFFRISILILNSSLTTVQVAGDFDDLGPVWSPDGEKIAFYSNRTGIFQIFTMDKNGGNVANISNDGVSATSPAWSPDGTRIAYVGTVGNCTRIFIMNANGTGKTQLTADPCVPSGGGFKPFHGGPRFHPTNGRIFFTSTVPAGAILSMNPDGSSPATVTVVSDLTGTVTISPDGQFMVFTRRIPIVGGPPFGVTHNLRIFRRNIIGTDEVELTSQQDSEPAWSPVLSSSLGDSNKIAFRSGRTLPEQIYLMNPNGSNQIQLTSNGSVNGSPSLFWPR